MLTLRLLRNKPNIRNQAYQRFLTLETEHTNDTEQRKPRKGFCRFCVTRTEDTDTFRTFTNRYV